MTSQKRPSVLLFLASIAPVLGSAGCATDQADLGGSSSPTLASTPPPTRQSASNELWKVVDNEQFLGGFSAQKGKLLWLAGTGNPDPPMATVERASRRHCDVANCAATVISIEAFPLEYRDTPLASLPSEVYSDGAYFYWYTSALDPFIEPQLASCQVDDPSKLGIPSRVLTNGIMGGDTLYGCNTSTTVAACRAADCDATIMDITPTMPADNDPSISPWPRAYADGYLYATSASKVFRYKTASAAAVEVLYTGHTEEMREFATNGSEIFWVEVLTGAPGVLKSCPATGCVDVPRVLMRELSGTRGLLVDDENVYVLEVELTRGDPENPEILPQGNKITRVPIAGTEAPTVLVQGVGVEGPMVISDDLIYFRGSNLAAEQAAGIHRTWHTHYIAAIPK